MTSSTQPEVHNVSQSIVTPPEDDAATSTGQVEIGSEDWTRSSGDMLADRQTHTRSSQYSAFLPEAAGATATTTDLLTTLYFSRGYTYKQMRKGDVKHGLDIARVDEVVVIVLYFQPSTCTRTIANVNRTKRALVQC